MRSNSSRATDVAGFPTQIVSVASAFLARPRSLNSRRMQQRIPGDVPQTVSALIDATRRLQSSLQLWSTQQISEVEVSDIFVAVGNEFNAMVAAFQYYNIDMRFVSRSRRCCYTHIISLP